jgi:hypothetical protein
VASSRTVISGAVIYAEPGADRERIERTGRDGTRTTFLAIHDPNAAGEAARALADQGVQTIELCGGMGLRPARSVIDAVGGRVPVGVCTFGVEAVTGAAEFKARAERGERLVAAFLYLEAGADPKADRVLTEPGTARTLFVPVPDESAAAGVASSLVHDDGVQLVELYRGIGPKTTAEVIDAVGDQVPVGSVLYSNASR